MLCDSREFGEFSNAREHELSEEMANDPETLSLMPHFRVPLQNYRASVLRLINYQARTELCALDK